jgi:hypothetical protein
MQNIIALAAGWFARTAMRQWALQRGLQQWVAELLAWAAGAAASTAVMSA